MTKPAQQQFKSLMTRLTLPAFAAPMFIVSSPKLVIAQCKAGIVGSFPALNARPAEALDDWLCEIKQALAEHDKENPDRPAAPFAINQIVHRSNSRLDQDMEACVKHKVPLVITSLGAREDVNAAVHSYGGMVFHDVINNRFARKAIEKGADGLIAVAAGAGGHAGTLSPFALVQEIREWFDGPLLLSGCIARGQSILAARAMGADGAYMGSLFIASHEANASKDYKQAVVEGAMEDIIYSSYFTGVAGNYIAASIRNAGLDPHNLPAGDPKNMDFQSSPENDAKAWKDIWGGGQGIGAVKQVLPAGEIIATLKKDYETARQHLEHSPKSGNRFSDRKCSKTKT